MRTGVDSKVVDFVAEHTGVARGRLSPQTTLVGDLGIDGADGWELLEEFGRKFEVDMSGFISSRHFEPEGLPLHAPFAFVWWLITAPFRKRQIPEKRAGLVPIRIFDLIRSVEGGKWSFVTKGTGGVMEC